MYCTYLTVYFGNKLPRRYIGSTSVENVLNGYNGSIKSKKWSKIYKEEQQNNKHLFKTRVLKEFATREDALAHELYLQHKYAAPKSKKYMNMSYATVNGWFGNSTSGFTQKHSEESKKKMSLSAKKAYEEGRRESPFKYISFKGEDNPFYGKKHSEETKKKMRKPKKHVPKWKCKYCDKSYDGGNLTQHMRRKHNSTNQEIKKWKEEMPSLITV